LQKPFDYASLRSGRKVPGYSISKYGFWNGGEARIFYDSTIFISSSVNVHILPVGDNSYILPERGNPVRAEKAGAGGETRPLGKPSSKMKTVTILDLQEKADELIRSVARTGEKFQIVDNGEIVAVLVPSSGEEKIKLHGLHLRKLKKR